jgi:3-hexulose-6-phosphate synthase
MSIPLLQVALDFTSIDKAIEVATEVEEYVDILEAGTPLIKSVGLINILPALKKISDKPLVADLKVADVADIEFEVAASYSANYVTILASSPIENIRDGIKSAKKNKLKIVADLIGVDDYMKKSKEVIKLGINLISVHCSICEQRMGKTPFDKTKEVAKAILPLGGKIVAAGGINQDNVHRLEGLSNIAIIIVGGGITKSVDPKQAAFNIKKKIKEIFK